LRLCTDTFFALGRALTMTLYIRRADEQQCHISAKEADKGESAAQARQRRNRGSRIPGRFACIGVALRILTVNDAGHPHERSTVYNCVLIALVAPAGAADEQRVRARPICRQRYVVCSCLTVQFICAHVGSNPMTRRLRVSRVWAAALAQRPRASPPVL
jgi:hypothetical protein